MLHFLQAVYEIKNNSTTTELIKNFKILSRLQDNYIPIEY